MGSGMIAGMLWNGHLGHTEEALSFWDRLWPLVVTAALTLLVFWVVQLFIVPRVEARKRREDRWERDVLDLGQLLTFEFPQGIERVRLELWWLSMLKYEASDVPKNRVEEADREHRRKLEEAVEAYRNLEQRVSWLSDRVLAMPVDTDSTPLQELEVAVLRLSVRGIDNLVYKFYGKDDQVPTLDDLGDAVRVEREQLKKVVDLLKTLATGPPPRSRSIRKRITSHLPRFRTKKDSG